VSVERPELESIVKKLQHAIDFAFPDRPGSTPAHLSATNGKTPAAAARRRGPKKTGPNPQKAKVTEGEYLAVFETVDRDRAPLASDRRRMIAGALGVTEKTILNYQRKYHWPE
jgi:hypothetical protein